VRALTWLQLTLGGSPAARILAEFGIVAPVGRHGVEQLLGVVSDASDF
jgi:hypothetical protein